MHRPVRARTLYFQMILLFLHSDGIQTLAHAGVVSSLRQLLGVLSVSSHDRTT